MDLQNLHNTTCNKNQYKKSSQRLNITVWLMNKMQSKNLLQTEISSHKSINDFALGG